MSDTTDKLVKGFASVLYLATTMYMGYLLFPAKSSLIYFWSLGVVVVSSTYIAIKEEEKNGK